MTGTGYRACASGSGWFPALAAQSVTVTEYIDNIALEGAGKYRGYLGDMLRVPGSRQSLSRPGRAVL
ncbi:MAG: hypothetical protein ACLRXA_24620 [Clostridium sp.]